MQRWKKEGKKKDGFRRKLGFTEFDIMLLSEYSIKSKTGNMFANEKALEEYYVQIYEIGFIFIRIIEEK